MEFKEHFHRNAKTIIETTASYKSEYNELIQTIKSISDFDLVKDSYIENALKGSIISSLDSIKEDSLEKLSAIIRKYLLS